jgi:hypothetical protein
MTIVLAQAKPGKWFDAAAYIPPKVAAEFVRRGYVGRFAYLRRDEHVNDDPDLSGGSVSLSRRELQEHLDVGLQVGLVQFASLPYRPDAASGTMLGRNAALNALALAGVPGVTLFQDLEWDSNVFIPKAVDVLASANAWADAAILHAMRAGDYVGPNAILTADQWYYDIENVHCYWLSAARVPVPSVRGACVKQHLMSKEKIAGQMVWYDIDDVTPDQKGDLPWVLDQIV